MFTLDKKCSEFQYITYLDYCMILIAWDGYKYQDRNPAPFCTADLGNEMHLIANYMFKSTCLPWTRNGANFNISPV